MQLVAFLPAFYCNSRVRPGDPVDWLDDTPPPSWACEPQEARRRIAAREIATTNAPVHPAVAHLRNPTKGHL